MKVLAIIPARLGSTRLPRKILRDIAGKSLIQRVYERVCLCKDLSEIIIAIDDQELIEHLNGFGAKFILTDPSHPSGTDRCAEVLEHFSDYTHVINVQGDEPFIHPDSIAQLIHLLDNQETQIASLMNTLTNIQDIHNPNIVKVVVNKLNEAMYFSRSPIPHQRGLKNEEYELNDSTFKHVGIYGFETSILKKLSNLPVAKLEQIEKLEQLRWLENSFKIKMGISQHTSLGIDTEEDLQKAILNFK